MSKDAMDVDPDREATSHASPLRKRKHKNKDHSPSKKRKHDDAVESSPIDHISTSRKRRKKHECQDRERKQQETAEPDSISPFNLVTSTLYLPLSPVSISPTHALASLIAEHLSPLLLTYYPPFRGIILAYSNASISSTPSTPSSYAASSQDPGSGENPQPLTLALTANEYGVLYIYLTATFLVFQPQRGQMLEGWVNVQSDGFLGAVVYNLFSVSIERQRLPSDWKWIPPGAEQELSGEDVKRRPAKASSDENETVSLDFDPEKEHFTPLPKPVVSGVMDTSIRPLEQEEDNWDSPATGYFQTASGYRVRGTIRFRVRDIDIIPGADPDRGFLSIEGTMLSPDEEARVVEEERAGTVSTFRRSDAATASGGILISARHHHPSGGHTTISRDVEHPDHDGKEERRGGEEQDITKPSVKGEKREKKTKRKDKRQPEKESEEKGEEQGITEPNIWEKEKGKPKGKKAHEDGEQKRRAKKESKSTLKPKHKDQ